MHREWEKEATELLARLERRWQAEYSPRELRQHLVGALHRLRRALARDTDDARLVVETYRQLLHHQATAETVQQANEALHRLLRDLGLAVLTLLPFSFITLPALFTLAHHLGIELASPETPGGAGQERRMPRPVPKK